MGSINRYVFRTTFGVFWVVLVSLTAVFWVTQALHDIDLVTNQGQNLLVFIGITGLVIPLLVLVIAPIALLIAVAHVLNKLSTDSEIIVMNAAGMSPWILFRAFLSVGIVISLMVAVIAAYFAPKGMRMLHQWITQVRANVVSTIVQPGRFTTIERGVTINIQARRPNGQLVGIFLDDQRDPSERLTILAEAGELLENDKGTFLVLQNGSIQRRDAKQRDPALVLFDRYAFDLSRFSSGSQSRKFSIRERYLWQLVASGTDDKDDASERGQVRAELSDRLMAPLYPIAFVIIAFAYLGPPRTNRQSRAASLLGAIAWVALLRLTGFASTVFGANYPWMLSLQYFGIAAAFAGGLFVIHRGIIIEPPAYIVDWVFNLRLVRSFTANES